MHIEPGMLSSAKIAIAQVAAGGLMLAHVPALLKRPTLVLRTLLATRARCEQPGLQATLWLLTDGRTLEVPHRPSATARVVIVDFDRGESRVPGRASRWAEAWGAHYIPSDALMP